MGFKSTVTPPQLRKIGPYDKWLVDPVDGTILGVQNPNAQGEDGYFYPLELTAAQIAAPTPEMIADTRVVYRLSVLPHTRYQSDGQSLVQLGAGQGGSLSQVIKYSPWTITGSATIYDETRVYAWPT